MKLSDAQIAQHAYNAGFRGERLVMAVAVALAESGGLTNKPGDEGSVNGKWGPSIGLWQIRSLHADRGTGRQRDELANKDPAVNARHAWQISNHGRDWSQWSVYSRTGTYKNFLGRARVAARSVNRDGPSSSGGRGGGGGGGRGGGRIVLDIKELARFERLMEHSRDRVEHSLEVVWDVAEDVRRTGTVPHLEAFFGAATGQFGLPMVARHLDWEAGLVQRIRKLALLAVGPDKRHGPEDIGPLLGALNGRDGLPERAVLEALLSGRVAARPHGRPRVPERPPKKQMETGDFVPAALRGFANGNIPPSKLVPVGDGEKLAGVAAKHFKRMAAAARAEGLNFQVNDGYRTRQEQQVLYERWLREHKIEAAPPGRSNHGWGLSVDLEVIGRPRVAKWLTENAARYGFFNDVRGEPWHWTYRPR